MIHAVHERTRQLIVANAKQLELTKLPNLSRNGAYIAPHTYGVNRQTSLSCKHAIQDKVATHRQADLRKRRATQAESSYLAVLVYHLQCSSCMDVKRGIVGACDACPLVTGEPIFVQVERFQRCQSANLCWNASYATASDGVNRG